MIQRGGRQYIPRPATYEIVGPAPWAHLGLADQAVTLETVRRAVIEHAPARPAPDVPSARPTAVLVAVFEVDGDAWLVLTKRPDTMPSHQGQIAFPGGKYEAALDASLTDTALREAEEEIALGRDHVEIVGRLDGVGTMASQFVITPFVGLLDAPVEFVAHPREVVTVFDVAVRELLGDEVFRRERWSGETNTLHLDMDFYELPGETVWGATARMLTNLLSWITGTS
ncbi:MAG TPA: CoA pyrophosphatase [Acidimicrobiia bacterium]